MSRPTSVVINNGSPAALVAFWIEATRRRSGDGLEDPAVISWYPTPTGSPHANTQRQACVSQQAHLCPRADVIIGDQPEPTGAGGALTTFLLHVAQQAADAGATRLVWPIQIPPREDAGAEDLRMMGSACDRAFLVGELVSLERYEAGSEEGMLIETPFVDFSDEQLIDLAVDIDAPLSVSWWCEAEEPATGSGGGARACGTCPACFRWNRVIRSVDPSALDVHVVRRSVGPVGGDPGDKAGAG